MPFSPPEMDYDRVVRAVKIATNMTYKDTGAADEKAYDIGKTVGTQFARLTVACRNFESLHDHLKKRREEAVTLTKATQEMLLDPSNLTLLSELAQRVKKLVEKDSDYFDAQIETCKKDLEESSAKWASLKKESEEEQF